MEILRRHRASATYASAIALPLALAAVLIPFRTRFVDTASALALVAVVAAVAVLGDRTAGVLASVSATVWFDLFLTRPYERFAITQRSDIETAVSLFVVGVLVTELAARSRHHRDDAAERLDYVGLIHDFSELAASGTPAATVVERARSELVPLLHLRACRYEPGTPGRPMARLQHDGRVLHGGLIWGVDSVGLPGPELDLVVQGRGEVLGRFVFTATPGYPVSLQRRVVAVAIADQVGASLLPQRRSA